MNSGIKGGRPWTNSGYPDFWEDNDLITDLSESKMERVIEWIKTSIIPRKTPTPYKTSYWLKHRMERELDDIYTTNNQFKDAMLMCGFYPVNEAALNWVYGISLRSPCIIRHKQRNGML